MNVGTMPYQYSVTSFTSREVLNILHNPDWSRVIREPPARPRAGEVFLFHYTDDCKKDDWRCDQYHFQHDGLRKQPRTNPKFYKNFFVLRTSRGKDKRFKKHAYVLLENHNNLVLFQYLGDESVAVDLPHGNSKDTSKSYTRLCPSVIEALKDMRIKPRDIQQQLQHQAQTSAVPGVMIPRSLSQISNTRCREKRTHKKVKKKTRNRKKKKAPRQIEQDSDLIQDHLVPAGNSTKEDVSQTTDAADVMSPQTKLNELTELCETIYQENMAGVADGGDTCDKGTNASADVNHTYNTVQSAQSNTGHVYPSNNQQTSPLTATSSVLVTGNAVSVNMSNNSTVFEIGPPQTLCLVIQDDGVSSTGVQVTDSFATLDTSAKTLPNLERDSHATSSHSDALQQHVNSATQTTHSSLECFFESQRSSGQLTGVIALMKETLKTEVVCEFKKSASLLQSESASSQTLSVRCIGESTSKENPPLPETAASLVAQVSRLWARDFKVAQQLLLKADFPGQDIQNDVPLLEVLAALVVGAHEAKSDCLVFLETLKIYPNHLLQAWSEQRTIDVEPDTSYRIGSYTVAGNDILRLGGTSWLDDSVIHAYLYLVQKQHDDARSQAVWIIECFQHKLWEKHNYSQWLYEQVELKKYDLLLMPICVNSHWVLLAAKVRDRTVCVINSKPSKDLEAEVSRHWMKYMECRSSVMEEDLRSWRLVQCPVFPQTDGSSCGVFVLMAAEALAAGVPPCLMRNCHVSAYRQYVKQRLMSAVEARHMVLATSVCIDEQADTVMSMEFALADNQVTYDSGSKPTPDVSNSEPTPIDCDMDETENVKLSEETTCDLLSKDESAGTSIAKVDRVPSDVIGLGNAETTRDRNFSVESSIPCTGTQTDEEDMKTEAAEDSILDHSGLMESESCESTLDHVSTQSQCEALFVTQKPNFTALILLCLEKGKLTLSSLDGATDACPLQGHMRWSCQLTRVDGMSREQFTRCLHGLSGSLLRSQESVVQFRYKDTQSHVEDIIKAAAVEYICELDPLFIYRHVKVRVSSLNNDQGFTIYLDKSRQKDLALHFAREIEKHSFAFTLTHQACGKHTFASTLVRSIGMGTTSELIKTCDKTHCGSFLNWMCFGTNAELYKVLSSYILEEERKDCVILCCVSGNSEILQLLLEDMELAEILSWSLRSQVVHGIDICTGQTKCLQTHNLPPLHLASYYGHTDIVQVLLQYGCDVNAQLQLEVSGQVSARSTPAAVAAHRGHTEVLKCLMESKADLSLVDCNLNTPLHLACKAGHEGSVLVLASMCKLSSRNKDGNTPVHLACQEGRLDVVDILLKRNADLTILNFDNCSPLHVVCSKGYSNVLQLMLNSIPYPLLGDGSETPLHTACQNGHSEIVRKLLHHGAGRSVSADKNTPLETAVRKHCTYIVSALLESRSNCYIDAQFLNLACELGHIDIVKLLIEKGADVFAADDGYTPLSFACRIGHTDIVKFLIEKGADVSAADRIGVTPLSWACRNGHIDIVKLLIEKGADVSAGGGSYTPLSWACENGHIDIVKLLIEKGADVSAADGVFYIPLLCACLNDHIDIVKLLIEKGADVSAGGGRYTPLSWACKNGHIDIVKLLIEKGADVSAAADDGYTPLLLACKNGHIDIVKLLIEKGADVSAGGGSYTPLSWACGNGHIDIVKLLIEKGADVSAADDDGCTPLSCANENGHIDIVKLLIEKGADVSAGGGSDLPLLLACEYGHTDIVKLLVEKGADVSAGGGRYTPLSFACMNGHIDIVKLLIEKGADVSAGGGSYIPLLLACENGHIDIVKLLIEKGADVSACWDGYIPLSCACMNGHIDIVKLLIEKGADVSAGGGRYTPLSRACMNGHIDIVKLLIEKGADVSAGGGSYTLLSFACMSGHTDIVKLLVEKGADVSAAIGGGDTPLSWACENGHIDIVKLLVEKGADVSAAIVWGDTLMSWACMNGHTNIVKLLVEKGADVSAGGGRYTPLSWACMNGHTDIVKLLIEKGADVSAGGGSDIPLLLACRNGHIDIVKLLIEKGADVSAGGGSDTPLPWACRNGHTNIVKLLIEKGADVSAGGGSDTPLPWACMNGHTNIVKLLIEKGADVSAGGGSDIPLLLACKKGHIDIVKLLIEKGADVSAGGGSDTPLLLACENGHIDIVKLLVEKGADVSAADAGYTPLSCACENGHIGIVNQLIEKGADVSAADGIGETPLSWACKNVPADVFKLLELNLNISAGWFAKGKRKVVSFLLKEVLPKHVTSLSNYCHISLIQWIFGFENQDMVKHVSDRTYQKLLPGRLCQSLLEKAVAKGDAYGVWLLTEYSKTGKVSNNLLLSLMSEAIEHRHIAVFQMLHCIPHVHDCCDTLVLKACRYGLVQVCNVLLKCGSTHSGTCLTKALKVKNVVLVELLLSNGVDVNACDDHGNTSLHLACEVGECSLVETVIAKGICLSQTNKRLETPLFVACRYGYANVAKLLLSLGADITTQDINGNTVLHSVCQSGQEKLLQLFLHYIWKVTGNECHDPAQKHFYDGRYALHVLHLLNDDGETPLHVACRGKCTGVVKLLLQHKASVFVKDKNGHTPLAHAMKEKSLFSVLCSETSDINGVDSDGNTLMHMACTKGYLESVDVLCRRKASVVACNKNLEYALHKSAENGNAEIMNSLLAHQADVNVTDRDKQTPLHIACAEGHLKIVELLIKSKVNVNVPDKHLLVPLHLACKDGHRNIADALIKSSANIESFSKKHYTPLIYACEAGYIDCVSLLLENGACANVAGFRGNNPLHRASAGGHVNVVRLLLSCGADPNQENDNGNLPLHHAVLWGHLAIVNMLLDKTKLFFHKMDNVMSLLERACSRGHVEIVKRLIDFIPVCSMSSLSMTSLVASVIHANHFELLPVLADKGLNINQQDECARNAFQMLCEMEDCETDMLEKVLHLVFALSKTTGQGESMLHVVCKVGNIQLVNNLIEKGIDIQKKDINGDTALHAACAHGHFEIAKVLIKKGLKCLNDKNARALSPLDLSIINTHYEVTCVYDLWFKESNCRPRISMTSLHHICRDNQIRLLYNSEIVFAEKDSDGNSALHIACEEGSEEIVQLLIIAGAWLLVLNNRGEAPVHIACHGQCLKALVDALHNSQDKVKVLSQRDTNGNAPLHLVTCEQNLGNLCILLDNYVDVELLNSFHQTALHIACYGGNLCIVRKLLGAGANVLAVDKSGNNPLHIVCKEGNLQLLMLINNKDVVITSKNYEGRTPFHEAVNHEHYDMIYYIMTEYCHLSVMDLSVQHLQQFIRRIGGDDFVKLMIAEEINIGPHGNTPLHYAAETASLEMVTTLIRRGYKCDARNKQGRTPLFNACSSGSTNIVKLILQESSASPVCDCNNMTPLHEASWKGHVDVVNLLLESGHKLLPKTNEGQTSLHLSCLAAHSDVAETLLKAGSDMIASDNDLDTPLHLAARSGVCDIVVLLAKWGARDTQCNKHGNTALHLACDGGHDEAVKALLNMGSDILATNNLKKTPLMLACDRHHESILELLLHRSWLQIQVQCSQDPDQGLLRKETFINNLNYCLLVACTYNYLNTVKLLLRYGVDINHRSSPCDLERMHRDRTGSSCASDTDKGKMEDGCTSHKDQIQMNSGSALETPLHSSCYEGHSGCVELLIQAGAQLEPRTAHGDTPLHMACKQGQERTVELLIANGVSLSPVNSDNSTPLHYACQGAYESLVSRLLEAGADADVRDVHGKSPLEVSSSLGVKNILHKSRCGRKRSHESLQEADATPLKVPRQQ